MWACHGHADTPGLVLDAKRRKWVAFSATQTCVGEFLTQQVCIRLMKKTDGGKYVALTGYFCSAHTVMPLAFKGRAVRCAAVGHGRFRTRSYGKAWPDGVLHRVRARNSYSDVVC